MPTECVHSVDFDKMEVTHDNRKRLMLRVGCANCGTAVTLDDVLKSLAEKVYNLNRRVLELEDEKETAVGEPVPDS
jgi:hypothetical protein